MQLWKTHARRIAALVCTLAMTACLLPSAAFATGAEPAAQPAAAQGETVDNATDTAKDTPQNKPENNAGDKTASAATDSTEDKAASTATDNAGGKTASTATDSTGDKTAATAADNAGDKTGDGEQTGDGANLPDDGTGDENSNGTGDENSNVTGDENALPGTGKTETSGESDPTTGENAPTAPQAGGDVARIVDGGSYDTLDDAIAAAEDGATIELLADATTDGMNLSKTLVIQAAEGLAQKPTITFNEYGIALWGKALTFKNCDVVMEGIGSTPYTAEWKWMTICANSNASLTLDNVTMTMDAEETTNSPHAIYFCDNNVLNLYNDTVLTIKNYANDALEWNGGNGGYNVNIKNSTFVSDHNRSGFTGTFYATIENSDVDVINSTGNGSNGSHFIIKNSTVDFNNNGSHGLSAGVLHINNSTVNAQGNGGMGITVNNDLEVTNNSVVTVTGNDTKVTSNYAYAAVRLYNDYKFLVDSTSKLYINNNYNTGLYVRQGELTVQNGAVLEIMGNHVKNSLLGGYGGGVYVGYGDNYDPKVILPGDAKIYNNHAKVAGDDIYVSEGVNGPALTFGQVGSDWVLDDCGESCSAGGKINGWYDDSENARWNAHAEKGSYHVERFNGFDADTGLATVKSLTCLKAAHDATATIQPADITIYMGGTNGYDGVSNGNGEIAANNSLPEPGFYITLPADINTALQNSGITPTGEYADLSGYLTIHTVNGDRNWTLTPYGNKHSGANERYIYRIAPQNDGQDPVRLEFTDEAGTNYISDEFDPAQAGNLYQDYEMDIYAGAVNLDNVVVDITIPGQNGASPVTYTCTMKTQPGKLKIRYVTGEQEAVVTEIRAEADALPEDGRAYATTPDDTRYFINGSDVDVTAAAAPSLLFDDVVSDHNTDGAQDYDEQLKESALTQVTGLSDPQYQAKYLDLVDANNGNVWLKSSEPVTVYWPYPAGTDKNTSFSLVHFQGLNREMSNGDISDRIDSAQKDVVQVENTEYGIKFTTSSFSPFVLLWDASQPETPGGTTDGGDPAPTPAPTPAATPAARTAAAPAAVSGVIPQTGDEMPVALLGGSAAAAAAALAVLLVVRKRRGDR